MKQVLQDLNNGDTIIQEVPIPLVPRKNVLIATKKTLVSAGTERMLVDFGKGNLIQKAKSQPDKVKQVIEKVKTDGLVTTIDTVKNKLDTPLPLGYCNVGEVVETKTDGFSLGDRVVSNGKHAEYVAVPKNLCAKIPDNVDDESAVFTVIGAIALQGIRLIKPTLGETVVVTGLGLIGLVAVQLLRAQGCRVLGIDYDSEKVAIAKQLGAEVVDLSIGHNPLVIAEKFSRGRGIDAVLITASTKSNDPIHQAATMCRQRGRIVLVGVVGMEMSRADFYEKELSFQVSCSYGPGRYDSNYEEEGHDYPFGLVRWTEQRNFEAILDMMSEGLIDMKPLISHRFKLKDAADAYDVISNDNPLGIILEYKHSKNEKLERSVSLKNNDSINKSDAIVGFIGAGNYASSVLVPAFANTNARLKSIASATGVSSVRVGNKNGIENATTDTLALINDPEINTVVITTRHDSHAKHVCDSLTQGKHVFVEKPLVLTNEELINIENLYQSLTIKPHLMVGFNRRYAPHIQKIKKLISKQTSPLSMVMTINAGYIPANHWAQDSNIGGGRIIGEACHFVDLLRFLAGSKINEVSSVAMDTECLDSVSIHLKFNDGSIGVINYLSNGSKSLPKERLEVFCNGSVLQLNNFRVLRGFGWPGFKYKKLWRQDKGQINCSRAFIDAINSGDNSQLIPFEEIIEVTRACFHVVEKIS